ncbi:MAG: hypothetical protein Faunusvirus35_5 [Faunusvirus sp.]|jgi:hypothetical protein|uniref:Uncharacterized protein n=1 Tax=Faunusvirus sp. TaxID=2487766 RepID=A0A3G4ZXN6_9VIRU|nr:MAG: hypothetical protein Faunusvirus35_5 [Faunusvirus sp.]
MSCSDKITIFNKRDLILYIATFTEQFDIFKLCLVSSITRKIILASSQIPLYHRIRSLSSYQLIVHYHSEKSILRNNIDTINNSPYIKSLLNNLRCLTENRELLKIYCSCKYGLVDFNNISTWFSRFEKPIKRTLYNGDTSNIQYFEDAEGYHYAENQWEKIIQCVKNTGCSICQIRNTFFDNNCFECIHRHEFKEPLRFGHTEPYNKLDDEFKDVIYAMLLHHTPANELRHYYGDEHYNKRIKLELQNIHKHSQNKQLSNITSLILS